MIPVNLSLFEHSAHSPAFLRLNGNTHLERASTVLTDYCVPANPYFPTPEIFTLLKERLETILKYYPSDNESIAQDLAQILDFDPSTLIVANGSTELITWIHELMIPRGLVTDVPTFGRWTDLPLLAGKQLHTFPRLPEKNFQIDVEELISFVRRSGSAVLVLCNPNNPTSQLMSRAQVLHLIDSLKELSLIVIDESFIDFSARENIPTIGRTAAERENVILLKSLGKSFGLHGIRAGYAVTNPSLAAKLRGKLPSWNVNAITEFLIGILPKYWDVYERSRIAVIEDTDYLFDSLRSLSALEVYAPHSNFLYVQLKRGNGTQFRNDLLTRHGFLIRECGNKIGSSSQYFRIATRTRAETDQLVRAIESVTGEHRFPN